MDDTLTTEDGGKKIMAQEQLERKDKLQALEKKISSAAKYFSLKTLWRRRNYRWLLIICLGIVLFFTCWGLWKAISEPSKKTFEEISYQEIVADASRGNIKHWGFKTIPDSETTRNNIITFSGQIFAKKQEGSFVASEIKFTLITYVDLQGMIKTNEVESLILPNVGYYYLDTTILAIGRLKKYGAQVAVHIPSIVLEDGEFLKTLSENMVAFWAIPSSGFSDSNFSAKWLMLLVFSPILWLIFLLLLAICNSKITKAKKPASAAPEGYEKPNVSFSDIAGIEEAKEEILMLVDLIKQPEAYTELGASLPSGALLEGPPGCGKTMLAKAIAHECGLPFIAQEKAGFMELYVGTGPREVRELFGRARAVADREKSRVIVFIDEIDAVGKRSADSISSGGEDEKNRTISQLLQEIDGIQSDKRIFVLAATNKPENIDRALLRPGRLSKKLIVPLPSLQGRIEILRVHSKNKKIDPLVDLEKIARLTPTGTSGADLADICNGAAIKAGHMRKKIVEMKDFEDAINEVLMGQERKGLVLTDREKLTFASHEAGHALVAIVRKKMGRNVPLPKKISIIPTTKGMGGYTQFLEEEEKIILTKDECIALIEVFFGGRIAEEIITGQTSSGAKNDYDRASALAEQMAVVLGMESDKLGQRVFTAELGSQYLEKVTQMKQMSPEKLSQIDGVIDERLNGCFAEAKAILELHRKQLKSLTEKIQDKEVLEFTPELIESILIENDLKEAAN